MKLNLSAGAINYTEDFYLPVGSAACPPVRKATDKERIILESIAFLESISNRSKYYAEAQDKISSLNKALEQ